MTHRRTLGRRLAVNVAALAAASLLAASCRTAAAPLAMPADTVGAALFESHCSACHGANGQGDGKMAIAMKVRPRNFREEPFFYVSTFDGGPAEQDLYKTIRGGRPGGEMPAHPWLTPDEVSQLAGYVREIHRLGWVERLETEFAGEDLDAEELDEIAAERADPGEAIEIPPRSGGYEIDPRRGSELFLQSCASCHGPLGYGDGLDLPTDEQGRTIAVRDLTRGRFRGGARGRDIYERIAAGIPGTPMPAALDRASDDIWQLVDYVRALSASDGN